MCRKNHHACILRRYAIKSNKSGTLVLYIGRRQSSENLRLICERNLNSIPHCTFCGKTARFICISLSPARPSSSPALGRVEKRRSVFCHGLIRLRYKSIRHEAPGRRGWDFNTLYEYNKYDGSYIRQTDLLVQSATRDASRELKPRFSSGTSLALMVFADGK